MRSNSSICIIGIALCVVLTVSACGSDELSKSQKAAKYDNAIRLIDSGNYAEVLKETAQIIGYKDVDSLRFYSSGMVRLEAAAKDPIQTYKNIREAYANFKAAGNHADAHHKAQECLLRLALAPEDIRYLEADDIKEDLMNLPEEYKQKIINESCEVLKSSNRNDLSNAKRKAFEMILMYKTTLTDDEKKEIEEYALYSVYELFAKDSLDDDCFSEYSYVFSIGQIFQHDKIREKVYQALVKNLENKDPVKKRSKGAFAADYWLRAWYKFIGQGFTLLGDYKDSPVLARKALGYLEIRDVSARAFVKNKDRFPARQKDKTIIVVYSQDDNIYSSLPQHQEIMRMVKKMADGDLFYTEDQSDAALIMYVHQSYEYAKSFQYTHRGLRSDVSYYQQKYKITLQYFNDDENIFDKTYTAKKWSAYSEVGVGTNKVRMDFSNDELNVIAKDLYEILRNRL